MRDAVLGQATQRHLPKVANMVRLIVVVSGDSGQLETKTVVVTGGDIGGGDTSTLPITAALQRALT